MYLKIFAVFILSFILISCASRNIELSSKEQMEFVLAKVNKGEAGTYIPWRPMEFTYKNYKDSPSIDSPEFEKIVEEKFENGACRTYYTKYSKTSYAEVKRLADAEKDSEAMFEMYLRFEELDPDDPDILHESLGYLLSAARMGYLNAYLEYHKIMGENMGRYGKIDEKAKHLEILLTFSKITPTSALNSYYISKAVELLPVLSYAGDYEHALLYAGAEAPRINFEYPSGVIAVEYLCEAYFRGCPIFNKSEFRCNIFIKERGIKG